MPAWSTDVRHLAPPDDSSEPAEARQRARFTRGLVEAATSQLGSPPWRTAVRCIAKIAGKVCGSAIEVDYNGADSVAWSCTCGERGVINGFVGTEIDLSIYVDLGPQVTWGMDEQEYELLMLATAPLPALRGLIVRAVPHAEIKGLLIVRATIDELDELYTLVEQLEDATRSRPRLEILNGLRRSIGSSMDGF